LLCYDRFYAGFSDAWKTTLAQTDHPGCRGAASGIGGSPEAPESPQDPAAATESDDPKRGRHTAAVGGAHYRRTLRSRILSKPRLISVKRASIIGSNSQSVKM
jgi:hypothetical protein